jgi:hypothetical protein
LYLQSALGEHFILPVVHLFKARNKTKHMQEGSKVLVHLACASNIKNKNTCFNSIYIRYASFPAYQLSSFTNHHNFAGNLLSPPNPTNSLPMPIAD